MVRKSLNFRFHCITILYHDARHPMAQPEDVGYLFRRPLHLTCSFSRVIWLSLFLTVQMSKLLALADFFRDPSKIQI